MYSAISLYRLFFTATALMVVFSVAEMAPVYGVLFTVGSEPSMV